MIYHRSQKIETESTTLAREVGGKLESLREKYGGYKYLCVCNDSYRL